MTRFKLQTTHLFLATAFISCSALAATEPDNSKTNQRVEQNSELNAQDQGNSTEDLQLTAKIRQAVVKTSKLSMDAKNIKIISVNGKVVLKGPVKTAKEKTEIGRIANSIAGQGKVANEIEIE